MPCRRRPGRKRRASRRSRSGGPYRQSWFNVSFLDLREDFNEAKAEGKRFAVIFEQRAASTAKMHNEMLSRKYINDYVRAEFPHRCSSTCGARAKSPTSTARA